MNLQENIKRIKQVMGLIYEQINPECEKLASSNLNTARDHWMNWLNHPQTIEKFITNHNIDKNKQEEIYKKYFDILKKLKIVYYDKDLNFKDFNEDMSSVKKDPEMYVIGDAFVLPEYPTTIFFNCDGSKLDVPQSIKHEIGHLIDYIHPLNPIKKVYNVFSDKKFTYSKKFNEKNLLSTLAKLGITDKNQLETLKQKYLELFKNERMQWDYVCDLWEKSVNISMMKDLFGLNPGQQVTVEHMKPYILLEKELVADMKWFIYCWIKLGFQDINIMLSRFNELAKNNVKTSSFV